MDNTPDLELATTEDILNELGNRSPYGRFIVIASPGDFAETSALIGKQYNPKEIRTIAGYLDYVAGQMEDS